MPWNENIPRRRTANLPYPTITICRDGRVTLNDVLYKMIGEPDGVTLFYDREMRRLGVRAGAGFPLHRTATTFVLRSSWALQDLNLAPSASVFWGEAHDCGNGIWAVSLPSSWPQKGRDE